MTTHPSLVRPLSPSFPASAPVKDLGAPNNDHTGLVHEDHLPGGTPLTTTSWTLQVTRLAVVIIPFVALAAAMFLLWGWGFSWLHLWLLVGGYILTAFGVTVGYHRLFTHKSFETSAPVKAIFGVLGSMAVEGSIIHWVAIHRRHHQHSDRKDDPHSPHTHPHRDDHDDEHGHGILNFFKGFYHSHCGWFFRDLPPEMARYVPDLEADKVTRRVSQLFPLWAILGIVIPTAIAFAVTGTWKGALLGFIWGGLVRLFFVHHVTWSVNSVCHLWGARPFDSHDHSRNNFIFGVLGFGEGWHNNHHAFPTSARHGLRWWQIDISYMLIKALELVGLVRAVKVPSEQRIQSRLRRKD